MIKVSVLMTAFNREKYIGEAIESVLSSTFNDFELIIVDDCSIDRTIEIAKTFEEKDSRVKVFKNNVNLGDYFNRNKAASYANGKYLKYFDSDDIMYPHCLSIMVDAMEKFETAAYGLSSISFTSVPFPICISPNKTYMQHFYGYGHFDRAPGSSIIRRDIFEKVGGFSVPKYVGDTELWFRLGQRYDLVLFQRDLVWDRRHSEAESIYEKNNKKIGVLREKLVIQMLESPSCPLEPNQIKLIKQRRKLKRLFYFVKRLFNN